MAFAVGDRVKSSSGETATVMEILTNTVKVRWDAGGHEWVVDNQILLLWSPQPGQRVRHIPSGSKGTLDDRHQSPGVWYVWIDAGIRCLMCIDELEPLDASQTADQGSPLPSPRPLPPCPSCGQPETYVGLLTIECRNPQCMHFVPAAPAPTTSKAVEVRGGQPIDDPTPFINSPGTEGIVHFSRRIDTLRHRRVEIHYLPDGSWVYYGALGQDRLPDWILEDVQRWVNARLAGRPDYTIDVP